VAAIAIALPLCAAAPAMASSSASAATKTVKPVADSYVSSSRAKSNYGRARGLRVGGGPGRRPPG
jgi:hypothetical protein